MQPQQHSSTEGHHEKVHRWRKASRTLTVVGLLAVGIPVPMPVVGSFLSAGRFLVFLFPAAIAGSFARRAEKRLGRKPEKMNTGQRIAVFCAVGATIALLSVLRELGPGLWLCGWVAIIMLTTLVIELQRTQNGQVAPDSA